MREQGGGNGKADISASDDEGFRVRKLVYEQRAAQLTVVRGPRRNILLDDVVAIDVPERRGRRVRGKPVEQRSRVGAKVPCDDVHGFEAVFDEVRVPTVLKGHVVLDAQEVHAMDRDGAVECVMDGARAHVRVADGTNHVEVNWPAHEQPRHE